MSRRSTRRNYSEKLEDHYEAEADDDAEDDEQEVTRCVCGQDELNPDTMNDSLAKLLDTEYQIKIDTGLFIQCDKCSVWQHGYCVGLFINEDVPDKYWCEQCKPDLHILVFESPEVQRTLYRPVNDTRKKLLADNEKYSRRKLTRKDRRSYDYDEQLQKALRESALEEEKRKRGDDDDDPHDEQPPEPQPEAEPPKNEEPAAMPVEEPEAEGDEEDEAEAEEDEPQPEERKEVKKKVKRVRKKEQRKTKRQKTEPSEPQFTKEELISQASKPRFVHEKSSIYDLRKRISAILEWLNRSQLDLEDEKETRTQMTGDINIVKPIEDNIVLMQGLTESILNWEQKYGKFAS